MGITILRKFTSRNRFWFLRSVPHVPIQTKFKYPPSHHQHIIVCVTGQDTSTYFNVWVLHLQEFFQFAEPLTIWPPLKDSLHSSFTFNNSCPFGAQSKPLGALILEGMVVQGCATFETSFFRPFFSSEDLSFQALSSSRDPTSIFWKKKMRFSTPNLCS